MDVKLFGGFEGIEPFKVGAIEAQYIVLGSPVLAPWAGTVLAVEKALNREKRAHHLDYGRSWSLGYSWEYPPRNETEAKRAVGCICEGRSEVGRVMLVWPSKEVMEESQ